MRPYSDYVEDAIIDSFNALARSKPVDRIAVSEICAGAEVSRTTFYRHFRDKYDVMNSNYLRMLDESLAQDHDFRRACAQMFGMYRDLLGDMPRVFQTEGSDSFLRFVRETVLRTMLAVIEENNPGVALDEKQAMQLDVLAHGIAGISRKWAEEGYALSPEQVSEAIYEMMPPGIRELMEGSLQGG